MEAREKKINFKKLVKKMAALREGEWNVYAQEWQEVNKGRWLAP